MYRSNVRSAGYCGFVALCALLLPGAVLAQDAKPATTLAQKDVEEIVVTGTRLPEPNLVSTSPTQAITAEDIKLSGKSDVSDLLALMPQVSINSLGQDLGNRTSGLTTAGGVSTADLRGLGPNRTLVLVDGRRLGVGSPNTAIQSPAPDLDQIPTGLIERVDVVTGGASAVYGSDAIAGVVNFIMKKNFEGLQLDGTWGYYRDNNRDDYMHQQALDDGLIPLTGTASDGQHGNVSVIAGANSDDGRANFTVYLGYTAADPVPSGARDYGQCQLFKDTDANGSPTGLTYCAGSSNSNWFQPKSGPLGGDATAVFSVLGNNFVPWGTEDTNPPAEYNSQQLIYTGREDERYNAGFLGHYDINDYLKPYMQFAFMNDKTHQQVAPAALFKTSNPNTNTTNYKVNCSNPLLSAQEAGILCSAADIATDLANRLAYEADPSVGYVPILADVSIGRRNVEGGGRASDYEHTNYRAVAGSTGDVAKNWSYDAYLQYYYTNFYNNNNHYLDYSKIDKSLVVIGTAAEPACFSGAPCVPYNIFSDGGVTPDQVNYLYTDGTAYGTTSLGTMHVDFTGKLEDYGVKLPTASEGVSVNVGYENRREKTQFTPDSAEEGGQLSGFGGAQVAINQSVRVKEWFGEARVPLVQDKPGVVDLDLDGSYRHSDYSTSGGVDTYGLGLQYAPVASARIRGSYQRAIRAPSIIELFNPPLVGEIQAGNDPCAPTFNGPVLVPALYNLAQCLNTVAPADAAAFTAAYGNGGTTNTIPQGSASQLSQLQGGNTALQPEKADTYSLGVTFTPQDLHLTGSIDYWLIDLKDEVNVLPASQIINNCPLTGNPFWCSQLSRSPVNWGLNGASVASGGYILQLNSNIAGAKLSGVDVQASYELELPPSWGTLNFQLMGTYLIEDKSTPYEGAHTYDCAGLFGFTCQTVNPKWHHILRTVWITPWDVSAALTWRYLDAVKQDNNDSDVTLHCASYPTANGASCFDSFNNRIPSYSYFDLALTYHAADSLDVRAGVNNLLDRRPPVVTTDIISGGQANTYETYDMLGRQIFVGITAKF